jgi:hypothetical protein
MLDPRIDLHDKVAEACVLAGLLREPDETMAVIREMKFDRGAFYHDAHQRLYDVLVYVYLGGAPEGMLVGTYDEVRRRATAGMWLASRDDFTQWLVDTWEANWFDGIRTWAGFEYPERSFPVWVAAAATKRVLHLAARRHAYHAARELFREALDPTGGADEIECRIDDTY